MQRAARAADAAWLVMPACRAASGGDWWKPLQCILRPSVTECTAYQCLPKVRSAPAFPHLGSNLQTGHVFTRIESSTSNFGEILEGGMQRTDQDRRHSGCVQNIIACQCNADMLQSGCMIQRGLGCLTRVLCTWPCMPMVPAGAQPSMWAASGRQDLTPAPGSAPAAS